MTSFEFQTEFAGLCHIKQVEAISGWGPTGLPHWKV
jgi:hypothetical protein